MTSRQGAKALRIEMHCIFCGFAPWREVILLGALMLTGCHGGMAIPGTWTPASLVDVNNSESGRMQVILCFGPVFSNHSVLRLECPDRPPLLWDPGGMYGTSDPTIERVRDVVHTNVPTAQQFWAYRRDACGEEFHYIYEWDLDEASAKAKYDVLLGQTDDFETGSAGGMCCKAICSFLNRYASDQVTVPANWTFPHDLGRHLFTQPVDRLRVFRKGETQKVYVH
jgi:hypothetical protein